MVLIILSLFKYNRNNCLDEVGSKTDLLEIFEEIVSLLLLFNELYSKRKIQK